MRKNSKKILGLLAAVTLLGSTVVMSGCGGKYYKADGLDGYVASQNAATSNGGFAVEKDGYVYFINGKAENSAENKFGDVVKGALMRIKTADLNAGSYDKAQTVVPLLFVASNYDAGIYIYGDYVYFATPTTDKDVKTGEIANTHIDFKRAKLDGTEVMKNYFYRSATNSAMYRFVKGDDGKVYLLIEENGTLKSINVEDEDAEPTVLVSGSSITYYFDEKNPENPNVYYTMGVTYDADTDMSSTASYNQIYKVNAATKVSVNAKDASYTVKVFDAATNGYKDYKTYDFDEDYLESKNEEAKKTAKEDKTKYKATYDLKDYTTYPYVNLGTLVVDGVGSKCAWTQYNDGKEADAPARAELQGYTYAISRYENGGVYYTRTEVAPNTNLYYLADNTSTNSISANTQASVVLNNNADVSDISNALFEINEGVHSFVYTSGSSIYKLTTDNTGAEASKIELTKDASGAKLWKTAGNTLYYTANSTDEATGKNLNGMTLYSMNYKGDADKYHPILGMNAEDEYKPLKIGYIDMASADSWYMPEIFGNTLMYANAQAYGTNSYYYISATDLTKVRENNEKYEEVFESIKSYDKNADLREAMEYYFRTGDRTAFDDAYAKDLYTKYEKEEFDKFVASKDSEGEAIAINKQSALIGTVGAVNDEDGDLMNEGLLDLIEKETVTEEEEEGGLKGWHIALIAVGGALVVAAAVVIPIVLVSKNRKKKAEQEATVNAYKRKKIDTTDDKSIDVYADETAEEPAEESEE
ncbi:MAG: hypothetical protein IKB20_00540 [Clostridia bacterium]|nr:hypothetical protein [Clostridia bacterium]